MAKGALIIVNLDFAFVIGIKGIKLKNSAPIMYCNYFQTFVNGGRKFSNDICYWKHKR